MSSTPPASAVLVSLTDAQRADLGAKYLGLALEALEAEERIFQHWIHCLLCDADEWCAEYVRLHREAMDFRRGVLDAVRCACAGAIPACSP